MTRQPPPDDGGPARGAATVEVRYGRSGATLHRRDCIDGMRELLRPGSVDVIVTSPPYNLGVRYGRYDDAGPREEYLSWIEGWARAAREVLSRHGSLFLNLGGKPSDPWGPFEVLARLRGSFALQNVIHWVKSISLDDPDGGPVPGKGISAGHYKPINSPRYVNDCHEYIFHLTLHGDVPLDRLAIGVEYQDKSNVARWKSAAGDRRCRGNTWFVPYRTIQSRDRERPHPATFPVRIPRMCILLHGLERARLVVDPFLGLGHTALACRELGVRFVGFEIDEGYFEAAARALGSAADASPAQEVAPGTPSRPPRRARGRQEA